jgi:hypothetical protein
MKHAIDLVISPPHTSRELQPLGVGVFPPLERILAGGTDTILRLDGGRWQELERAETTNIPPRTRMGAQNSNHRFLAE